MLARDPFLGDLVERLAQGDGRVVKKILPRPRTTNMVSKCAAPVSSPSISVWPRCSEPAAQMASLLIGEVTMPSTSPAIAARVAASIAATAERPATASTLPHGRSAPGDAEVEDVDGAGLEACLAGASRPRSPRRPGRSLRPPRRSTAASPTAMSAAECAAVAGSARVRAVISGPMPDGVAEGDGEERQRAVGGGTAGGGRPVVGRLLRVGHGVAFRGAVFRSCSRWGRGCAGCRPRAGVPGSRGRRRGRR